MAISINKLTAQGNVGRDPDIKSFPNGNKIANFSIGVSESWKDKTSGEWKEKTEWISVSVQNGNLVNYIEKTMKKGSRVYVEGKLQTRKYTTNDGVEKYVTEVIVGPYNGTVQVENKSEGGAARSSGGASERTASKADTKPAFDLDDDLPF